MAKGKESLTPAMRQYKAIKKQYPDALLLFRMGDFYEIFYQDAIIASKALDIALTSRNKSSDDPIPMCGVPYHALDNYLAMLIKQGYTVAICEQVEDPKKAKGLVKRELVRIITPGTICSPELMESKEYNYLASVFFGQQAIGYAFVDISVGNFWTTEFTGAKREEQLREELGRLSPKEILVPQGQKGRIGAIVGDGSLLKPLPDWQFGKENAIDKIKDHFGVSSLRGFGCEDLTVGLNVAGAVLEYLMETQRSKLRHIRKIKRYRFEDYMVLDEATRRNLELVRSLWSETRENTLLSTMDRTVTPMGARKLKDWLLHPLLKAQRIKERLDAVGLFFSSLILRDHLTSMLKGICDLERVASKISVGTANPRDLIQLLGSIKIIPRVRKLLGGVEVPLIKQLIESLDILADIKELIEKSIMEHPPISIREGGFIRNGYNPKVDELRRISREGRSIILSMEADEKRRTGIPNLKIKYNKVFGYFIEISKAQLHLVPQDYIRKQTLVNAERFITPQLKEFEEKVLTAQERLEELEYELFVQVREQVADRSHRILACADILATIDVMAALGALAAEQRYCKPIIDEGDRISIKDGRHPVMEKSPHIKGFIPNDCRVDSSKDQILIITGPNMAGKSTYIRQVALIVLMAQIGSFVPASEAHIGLVDRIFTRVGASDNIAGGESTFMVEMTEASNIINNATDKSLIILDEIGRGTSTFDGMSIAWATVEYLHKGKSKGPRTLFATHYHELTDLAVTHKRVKNYTMDIAEQGKDVVFLRKVVPGKANKSYGIHVARLAGMPPEIIQRAEEILQNLEKQEFDIDGKPTIGASQKQRKQLQNAVLRQQVTIYEEITSQIRQRLKSIDITRLTPLEAMKILDELKKLAE